METRRVRALVAKTEFVEGYGQIVLDAGSARQELREPVVPVPAIPSFVKLGYVLDDIETLADDAAALAEMTGAGKPEQPASGADAPPPAPEPVIEDATPPAAPAAPRAPAKPKK